MKKEIIKILLADDNERVRMLFVEAFAELKINTEVNTVIDGQELMEHLDSNRYGYPQFIFLDKNLPLKNGIKCLIEV